MVRRRGLYSLIILAAGLLLTAPAASASPNNCSDNEGDSVGNWYSQACLTMDSSFVYHAEGYAQFDSSGSRPLSSCILYVHVRYHDDDTATGRWVDATADADCLSASQSGGTVMATAADLPTYFTDAVVETQVVAIFDNVNHEHYLGVWARTPSYASW